MASRQGGSGEELDTGDRPDCAICCDFHRAGVRHRVAPRPGGAAREAADGGFDVLIACAFNYDAHTTEFESLGRVPVLKARMNADLHMAGELKQHRQRQPVRHLRRARHFGGQWSVVGDQKRKDGSELMTSLKSYQDLEVWKKSMDLAAMVYRSLCEVSSGEERFGITSKFGDQYSR